MNHKYISVIIFIFIFLLSGCSKKSIVNIENKDKDGYIEVETGEILSDNIVFANVNLNEILDGKLISYKRLKRDNKVFELLRSDKYREGEFYRYYEAVLIISEKENNDNPQIISMDICMAEENPDCKKMVYADVDFNGMEDLLIYWGSYGVQGSIHYECFLQNEVEFEYGKGFSNIPNPCIDIIHKEIRGSWRNNAASHSWAKYKYVDGEFIEDKVLTEKPLETGNKILDDENVIWVWDVDGLEIARSDKNSKEEIANLIENENSEWRLLTDCFTPLWQYDKY